MKWSGFGSPLLAALVVLAATALTGCTSNATSPTTPPTLTTETFTGTMSTSGTNTYLFYAKSGQVTVTLASVTPDSTLAYSLAVGTYSAAYLICTPAMENDSIKVGQPLISLATATTAVCVTISDFNSVIPSGVTESYTITATHY